MTELVSYREIRVQIKVQSPNRSSYQDWERELKRKIQRTVNAQAPQRRHGVKVTAPGIPWGAARDDHFVVDVVGVSVGEGIAARIGDPVDL